MLLKYYKMRDFLFPKNTRRRFIAKLAKKVLTNPSIYWNALSFDNLRKLLLYATSISEAGLENKLDAYDSHFRDANHRFIVAEQFKRDSKGNKIYDELFLPVYKEPLVSIIIPVYNQFDYTYLCLKSIIQHTHNVSYEVIIADDCSDDKTKEICKYIKNVVVVRNEKNLRFLLNCNNAAKYAKGKYIHFLNNDTQVQEDWLSSLVRLIESNVGYGMVGSKLVYPDGKLQEAGGILWCDGSAWNYGNMQDPEMPEYNYVKEADYISGASIMIKADLWREIGGFDERFAPAYCEDSDLAFEVRKRGFKVMYQPKSIVIHFEGVSNGTDTSTGLKAYQVANSKKFCDKWKSVLENEHFNNAVNVFQARDRTRDRHIILVVDHYVPEPDRDAGSRTVFQYIKQFCGMGYNVKFIGDNFYRKEPYTSDLQMLGVEVLYGANYAKNWGKWIKNNSSAIDFVFLNRPHISVKYIDCIRQHTDAKIFYYGHDLHFLREYREYELTGSEVHLRLSQEAKRNEIALMKKADMTYYPSQIEINEIHKIDESISTRVIPAYIYPEQKECFYTAENRSDLMFVGGFNHTPNVDGIKWFHDEIWPLVKSNLLNVKIFVIGSHVPASITDLNDDRFCVKGFVTDEELDMYYASCKIDVAPLRYGAGIKGKIVEAMYHQIPVVTTSVGAEGIDDENLLTVEDDPIMFANRIIEIYNNHEKLKHLSINGCKLLNNKFTEKSVKKVIITDFVKR